MEDDAEGGEARKKRDGTGGRVRRTISARYEGEIGDGERERERERGRWR
jgi:hypothetical protein